MDTDFIILIAILISFFGLLIIFVHYVPKLIIKFRSKSFGLKLNLKQATIIQKSQCANKEFFNNVKEIQSIATIPTEKLAVHLISGGDLTNIKNGITELKNNNLEINFSIILAIDLTNKDIKNEVIKSQELQTILLSNIENKNLIVNYQITFRPGFPDSIWNEKTIETKRKSLEKKLVTFMKDWNEIDIIKTEFFIRENILNIDYLEKEISRFIEKQEYKINNNRQQFL